MIDFITGNNFKNQCHYSFDEYGVQTNPSKIYDEKEGPPIYFIKIDFVDKFFNDNTLFPKNKFILVTHNGALSVNKNHQKYLDNPLVIQWFAQNVDVSHSKLKAIPLGIANPKWAHGNINILQKIIDQNITKNQLMYANFRRNTNIAVRDKCHANIDLQYIDSDIGNVSFELYLQKVASSYFQICPLGRGIDSHRIWESLYLKTIPIAEKTYNISQLIEQCNLPVLLLNDWSELKHLSVNTDLYHAMIRGFDPSILRIESFLKI